MNAQWPRCQRGGVRRARVCRAITPRSSSTWATPAAAPIPRFSTWASDAIAAVAFFGECEDKLRNSGEESALEEPRDSPKS